MNKTKCWVGDSPMSSRLPGQLCEKSLNDIIEGVLKAEADHETYTERYLEVYAKDGFIRDHDTGLLVSTEFDSIIIKGADDHVFKDYMDLLWIVYGQLSKSDGAVLTNVRSRETPKAGAVHPGGKLTKAGRALLDCCRNFDPRWAFAYIHHVFHPVITLMLRIMRRYGTQLSHLIPAGTCVVQDCMTLRLLTRLSRFFQRVVRSFKFVAALRDRKQQEESNFASARAFILSCAKKHSKLLILRIDLFWQPYDDASGGRAAFDNFTRWLRSKNCRKTLLPSYLGFIVKEENGISRGLHWHLMVVAKGNLQRSAGYLTEQLGKRWAKRTAQGPGSYHNCYADRTRYTHNGLGVLELDDLAKMVGLRRALHYMTKQDCVLSVSNGKVRHFWRSTIKAGEGGSVGRPRASNDGLRLLRRMLGGRRSKLPPGMATPTRRRPIKWGRAS